MADVIGRLNPVVFAVSLLVAVALLASVSVASARTVVIGRSVRGRAVTAQVLGPDTAPRKICLLYTSPSPRD